MAGKTARISRRMKTALAVTISSAVLLSGCADGIEINSRALDVIGISTAALSRREEPKLTPRAPLVMPPSTQRLPEPGQTPAPSAVAAADPAWPKDRDQERVAVAAEKKRAHASYCRDGNWKERAMDGGEGYTTGPDGPCGSVFSIIGNWMTGGGSSSDAEPNP